jgi:dolichyl-phosphate-mannose-protein mannosyltransferase
MTQRILALIALGFLLRFAISAIFLPESGFRIDISGHAAWAQRMAAVGPGAFYEPGYFADYPPGYLYVLWVLGSIGAALAPVVGIDITPGLVKIPAVLADLGVAAMLYVLARRYFSERAGIAAAVLYLFNPGTIFNASVWGQVDSVGTLVVLITIYLLARGWTEAAAVGAGVRRRGKLQFAVMKPGGGVVGG